MKLPAAPREWDILQLSEGDLSRGTRLETLHLHHTTTQITSIALDFLSPSHAPAPATQYTGTLQVAIERTDGTMPSQSDQSVPGSNAPSQPADYPEASVNNRRFTTRTQFENYVLAQTRPFYVITKFLNDMALPIIPLFPLTAAAFTIEILGVEHEVHPRLASALGRCRQMGWSDTRFRAMAQALANKLLATEFELRTDEDVNAAEADDVEEDLAQNIAEMQINDDGGAGGWNDNYDAFESYVLEQ